MPALRPLVLSAALVAGCASSRQPAATLPPVIEQSQAVAQVVQWSATLASEAGTSIGGTATVVPAGAQGTTATVSLTGAAPGGVLPWHLHAGRCGDNGPIVGAPEAYPPLTVGADGAATAMATVPVPTPVSGDFHVNVHRSAGETGTVIACGNLSVTTR